MKQHEQLAERICMMLTRLNSGETLNTSNLASEFNVSIRTVQRDLNNRLAFLPLTKTGTNFSLDRIHLGQLSFKDIRNFSQLVGAEGIFPSLDNKFLSELLSNAYNQTLTVKASPTENESFTASLLKRLNTVISSNQKINFNYKNKEYINVEPYKLVNTRGVWYLAADDNGKLKSFHISKLVNLLELSETFTIDESILQKINVEEEIYFGKDKIEVIIKVDQQVATYFKRKDLLPEQEIIKELDNGNLLLSTKIAQSTQITSLVKHWMPHLTVISPSAINQEILKDIDAYLAKTPRVIEAQND